MQRHILQQYWIRNSGYFGKARCEPGWTWEPRVPMPDYDLWFVADGSGSIQVNGDNFPLSRGTCMLIHPGDRIYATQHPEHRLQVIYFHFRVESASEVPLSIARYHQLGDPNTLEWILNRLIEAAGEEESAYAEAEVDLWVKAALLQLYREEESIAASDASAMHKQLIRKITATIRERMPDPITVAELADEVGYSPRYVSRLFTQYTGYSLKSMIVRVRMDRARFLLTETSMNISQVASAVGCYDIYHFSKQFKQVYGEAPSAVRHRAFVPSTPH